MEPKYYAEEVIGHPRHQLRIWLDACGLFTGGGHTQNISSFEKKKHGISIHTPQRFRWQANLSSVGQVTLYLTNRLDEERILVWCLPKKVNSKWHTHQKWIWSENRETSPGFENTKSPQIHDASSRVLHRWPWGNSVVNMPKNAVFVLTTTLSKNR